jgi:hypothetical protein
MKLADFVTFDFNIFYSMGILPPHNHIGC